MRVRPARLRSRALFWGAALLWLPAGVAITAAVRFGPLTVASGVWPTMSPMAFAPLVAAAPCGLPLWVAAFWLGRRRRAGGRAAPPPLDERDRAP